VSSIQINQFPSLLPFTYPLIVDNADSESAGRGTAEDSIQVVNVGCVGEPEFREFIHSILLSIWLMTFEVFTTSTLKARNRQPVQHSQRKVQLAIAGASTAFIEASKRRRELLQRQLTILGAFDLLQERCTYY
jgi:hypothetical protein